MYRRLEEMYKSIAYENSQDWGLYKVHCKSKKCFYKLLGCWSANPTPCPLCCPSPPRGDGRASDQLCVLLFPSLLLSPFFQLSRGFVSTASYSELGQLSDARWPNSARPSLNSLRKREYRESRSTALQLQPSSCMVLLRRDCSYCRL